MALDLSRLSRALRDLYEVLKEEFEGRDRVVEKRKLTAMDALIEARSHFKLRHVASVEIMPSGEVAAFGPSGERVGVMPAVDGRVFEFGESRFPRGYDFVSDVDAGRFVLVSNVDGEWVDEGRLERVVPATHPYHVTTYRSGLRAFAFARLALDPVVNVEAAAKDEPAVNVEASEAPDEASSLEPGWYRISKPTDGLGWCPEMEWMDGAVVWVRPVVNGRRSWYCGLAVVDPRAGSNLQYQWDINPAWCSPAEPSVEDMDATFLLSPSGVVWRLAGSNDVGKPALFSKDLKFSWLDRPDNAGREIVDIDMKSGRGRFASYRGGWFRFAWVPFDVSAPPASARKEPGASAADVRRRLCEAREVALQDANKEKAGFARCCELGRLYGIVHGLDLAILAAGEAIECGNEASK